MLDVPNFVRHTKTVTAVHILRHYTPMRTNHELYENKTRTIIGSEQNVNGGGGLN